MTLKLPDKDQRSMTDSTNRVSMHHTGAPVSIDMHIENKGISHYNLEQVKRAISSNAAAAAADDDEAVPDDENESEGILASGFGWLQRKREEHRRQNLQEQAEHQLRKIYEAERKQASSDESLTANHSGESVDEYVSEHESSLIGEPKLSESGEGAIGKLDIVDFDEDDDFVPDVRLQQEVGSPRATILNQEQMNQIANLVLPKTISFCRWKRLYDLGRDGDSFDGCLRMIHNTARTLMVIRTTRGAVFGGYADSAWNTNSSGSARFYGGASACLFSLTPGTDKLKVYKWTGKNRYIQLCDVTHKMFAFGGGGQDGAFGLAVEEDFQRGSTGPCDTFDNEPLCQQENFEIVDVEFWAFSAMW
jgi:hypothetical protein